MAFAIDIKLDKHVLSVHLQWHGDYLNLGRMRPYDVNTLCQQEQLLVICRGFCFVLKNLGEKNQ